MNVETHRDEAIVSVSFQLKPQTPVARFIELSVELSVWLQRQPGFLRYELYRSDTGWTDTMLWSDRSAAEVGNDAFMKTELARQMISLVESGYRSFAGVRVSLEDEKVVA